MFKEIDQEKDGEIYLKEVVLYLKALNQDMETLEVKHQLDQYELRGMEVLDFSEFVVRHLHILLPIIRSIQDIMEQLESVGWVRVEKKESFEMTELDVDEIFKMIDVDKSGAISRSVSSIFNCFFFSNKFQSRRLELPSNCYRKDLELKM